MAIANLFPKTSGIGMTVQSQTQRADWVAHPLPRSWPPIPGQSDPCRGAAERGLRISLDCVRLLDSVSGQQAVTIACLSSLQRGRRAPQILENSHLVVFVTDIISLEDNTTLVLARRVSLWELGPLFDTDFEDAANMDFCIVTLGLGTDGSPFADSGLVPCAHVSKTFPLLGQRGLGLWDPRHLRLIDGTSNAKHGARRKRPKLLRDRVIVSPRTR